MLPGKWKMGFWSQLPLLPAMARIGGLSGLKRVVAAATLTDKAHPAEPHYYLLNIGVEPATQGRGIGTQLMQPMMQRCDSEKVGAYLETSTERDIFFYRRLGFEITGEIPLPDNGPKMTLMWRAPA
jgi:ribosomal protein S18 acetylase RimI-like enzyme